MQTYKTYEGIESCKEGQELSKQGNIKIRKLLK